MDRTSKRAKAIAIAQAEAKDQILARALLLAVGSTAAFAALAISHIL